MNIQTTARHFDLTPAVRRQAEDKLQHVLSGVPRVTNAHIILDMQKLARKAEVVVHVQHHTLEASAEADDLYAAIDLVMDKLSRQVEKIRDIETDHKGPRISG